jgi:hypothetical protein
MTSATLFQEVIRRSSMASKWSVAIAVAVGISEAVPDALQWFPNPSLEAPYVATAAVTVAIWISIQYPITLNMIKRRASIGGLLRYTAANLALFLPVGIGIGSAFALPALVGKAVSSTILITGLFTSLVAVLLLRAWPIEQALSSTLVSPIKALKATKGHRWALILISSTMGGVDKLIPSDSELRAHFGPLTYIVVHGAVNSIILLGFSALAAGAWVFASRADAHLIGDQR